MQVMNGFKWNRYGDNVGVIITVATV